jgi:hypothetical protein
MHSQLLNPPGLSISSSNSLLQLTVTFTLNLQVKVTLRLTLRQSVCLGVDLLLFDSYCLAFVGCPL